MEAMRISPKLSPHPFHVDNCYRTSINLYQTLFFKLGKASEQGVFLNSKHVGNALPGLFESNLHTLLFHNLLTQIINQFFLDSHE